MGDQVAHQAAVVVAIRAVEVVVSTPSSRTTRDVEDGDFVSATARCRPGAWVVQPLPALR